MQRESVVHFFIQAAKNNNFGAKVYEWLARPVEASELPVVIVKDEEDRIDGSLSDVSAHRLRVTIEVIWGNGDKTAKELRAMMQEILHRIKEQEERFMGYLAFVGASLEVDQHEFIVGSGVIEIDAVYNTAKWEL